jgi:large subunit ribosomal protein L10
MKKIGLIVRETLEKRIKNYLQESNSVFIITYSKLSSPDLSLLRQMLRAAHANIFVAKNSVARRALKDSGFKDLLGLVQGPCGLVFIKAEPVAVSKILCNFSKDHEPLKLEGGFLEDKILGKKEIETIARLPGKEVLRAQLVTALNSPLSGLVCVLKQTLKKIVYCLDQIKQKKAS